MSAEEEACVTEEQEWVEEEVYEQEEDTSLYNAEVVVKYKQAAKWVNEVLQEVIKACVVDASVVAIVTDADALIAKKVASSMKKIESKGAAFPPCVSVNNAVCHFSPTPGEDDVKLKLNDVCRIELGIQIDGYPAFVAHTIQVTENGELNPESPAGKLIGATYAALDVALRSLRPGLSTYGVTDVMEKVAAHTGFSPIEGVLSHEVKRHIMDGFRSIPGKQVAEAKVFDYELDAGTVWALDVVFTTGKGKGMKESGLKTTVFKQSLESDKFHPKLEAAQLLKKELDKKFALFPFAVRNLENKKARLGMSELLKHDAIVPVPVLYEKAGEVVARFQVTVLVTDKKIERVTGIAPQKGYVQPEPYTDEELLAASKQGLSLQKKLSKKEKEEAAAAAESPSAE